MFTLCQCYTDGSGTLLYKSKSFLVECFPFELVYLDSLVKKILICLKQFLSLDLSLNSYH